MLFDDNIVNILEQVDLPEVKGKDENFIIHKGVKFNNQERLLVRYLHYKNYKFSSYVKELMRKDILREFSKQNHNQSLNISEDKIYDMIQQCLANSNQDVDLIKDMAEQQPKEIAKEDTDQVDDTTMQLMKDSFKNSFGFTLK